ncbi:ead/Ea22-like family protein [Klebsiella pneumoniae]|uniref:ead/Ea22-like family protein n=1 Tax=Klebsiella pneumoniae TaxID=573 RepID=UPI003F629834
MTDITELAQSLKALANNAGADYWQAKKIGGDFYVIRKGSYKRECGYTTYQPIAEIDHKPTRDYVAMANPTNILALVEALEKSEKTSEARREAIGITHKRAARERDRANAAEEALEKAQAQSSKWLEAYHKAVSIGARYEERIAELESRTVTVKLPPKIERNDADGWFMYNCGRVGGGAAEWYNKALDDVGAELTAAGIKVEAE